MATANKAVSSRPTVDLLELEVIRTYSIALRQATAPRAAVIASLRADLARLEATDAGAGTGARRGRPPKNASSGATPTPVSRTSTRTSTRASTRASTRTPTKARPTPARSTRRG